MMEDSFVAEELATAHTLGEAQQRVNLPVAYHIKSCWCRNKYAGPNAINQAADAVWRYSNYAITRLNGPRYVV